jgi:hypothetical protein
LFVLAIASVFSYKANVKAGNVTAGLLIGSNANLNEYQLTGVKYQGTCPGYDYAGEQIFRFIDEEVPAKKGLKVMVVNEHIVFKNEPYTIKDYDEKSGYSEQHTIDGLFAEGKNDNDYIKIGPGVNNFRYYIYSGKDDKDGRQPKIGQSQIIKEGKFTITPVVTQQTKLRDIQWKLKTYCYDELSTYTGLHLDVCNYVGSRMASVEYGYCNGQKVAQRNFRVDKLHHPEENHNQNGTTVIIVK